MGLTLRFNKNGVVDQGLRRRPGAALAEADRAQLAVAVGRAVGRLASDPGVGLPRERARPVGRQAGAGQSPRPVRSQAVKRAGSVRVVMSRQSLVKQPPLVVTVQLASMTQPGPGPAALPGWPCEPAPDLGVSQLGEQAPASSRYTTARAGRPTDAALDPAGLLQHRVDHLERHLPGQLTEMTGRTALRPPSRRG